MNAVRARPGVLYAGLAGMAAVAALVVVLVLAGAGTGPATGAASLIPADALLDVNVSIDRTRPAVRQANRIAARFPDYPRLAAAVSSRLSAILGGGVPLDFRRQIRPWLGKEAAFAVLNTQGANAGSLIILDVTRHGALFDSGAVAAGSYGGVRLYHDRSGSTMAFVGRYLVVGQEASVRAAIDTSAGRSRALAGSAAYQAAAAGEPPGRVLDAYLSADGVRRILAPRGGVAGAAALLLLQPGFRGVSLALTPAAGGAAVRVHSARGGRGSQGASPPFSPTMDRVTPGGSPFMLGLGNLVQAAHTVLGAAAQLGLFSRLGPLLARLGAALSAEGVSVASVESIFAGEGAVVVGPAARAPAPILMARTRDPAAARRVLAGLEAPLAQLFQATAIASGQVPEWSDQVVPGASARQFVFAPGLQIDYAVLGPLVVLSSSLKGIAALAARSRPLAANRAYRQAFPNRPSRVTSLLFLDFSQLLSLGEQTGLLRSSRLIRLRPDLDRIRAAGSSSTSGEADTTVELFLKIS